MTDRAIRRYCAIWGRPVPVWKQVGGSILFKGHPISIRADITGNFILIHGGKKAGNRPCFIVEIDTVTRNSTLIDLEAGKWGDTCFTDGYIDSHALVKAAVWIAASRGARRIEFTDNSVVRCKGSEYKIDLAELSFITTGQTWYERLIPGLTLFDPIAAARLEVWRRQVQTATWATVSPFLAGIEEQGSATELAKDVLARMKKNGAWCEFFANNMDILRKAFGIERRLHGSQWFALLGRSQTTRRTHKRRKSNVAFNWV